MAPVGFDERRSGAPVCDQRFGDRDRTGAATPAHLLALVVAVILLFGTFGATAQPRELKDVPPEQETAKLDLGLFELDLGKGHWFYEPASRRAFCLSLGVSSGLSIMLTNFTMVNMVGLTPSLLLRIAKIASVPLLMGATWAMCGLAAGSLPDWGSFPPWSRGPAPTPSGPFS